MKVMDQNLLIRLEKALLKFVERVSKGETTSEAEVLVLSEVASTLGKLLKD